MLTVSRQVAVKFQNAMTDRKGVTVLEYGVLGALILVGVVGALTILGPQITNVFTTISGKLPS